MPFCKLYTPCFLKLKLSNFNIAIVWLILANYNNTYIF